ncbi:MAG: L-2-hydroxyglutarate oxidase, partial [Flavobacteriales bacterium]|nr:L-2-hydroxyglutarate oxidase [Flavobacteriales bacterium]
PECKGAIAGIWVPCTGIIDFRRATETMIEVALSKQSQSVAKLGEEVTSQIQDSGESVLYTKKGVYRAKHIIYCGGLQADRLALKDKVKLDMRIVGFRGDYYDLAEHAVHKVKNLIYPVPNPKFPFLGVHFTRMVNGGVECGPNAVFTFKREGYSKTSFSFKDTSEALGFGGTWKFFQKHWKFGIDEYKRAFSKKLFLNTLRRLIPSLEMNDLVDGRAGVRAMALADSGNMIDDFKIEYKGNSIHVLNAPSPAATAALSIGDEIVKMADDYFNLA